MHRVMNGVRQRREALRVEFSQHHLARLTGIGQNRISLIERGLIDPRPDERVRLARALRCTVQELWPEEEVEDYARVARS